MPKDLSIKQKKDWAKLLYLQDTLTQKAIAEKVGVTEKTISGWVNDENWEELRKSLLVTKEEQLSMLYNQLSALNKVIKDDQKCIPTAGQSDSILKITAAIKNLETETSLTEVFEVGKKFIKHLQQTDFEKAKEVVDLYDGFIKQQLKRN
jgi:transcriptional regulator with XRE-family HTH domain